MIDRNLVRTLGEYKDTPYQILTIYLGSEEMSVATESLLTSQLNSLLHTHANKQIRLQFEEDIIRVRHYLKKCSPKFRSIAFFSARDMLWEAVSFEFYLPPNIYISNSAQLIPILTALNDHRRYMILLIDREKVKMLVVDQGEIIDSEEFYDYSVPQRVKSLGDKGATVGRVDKVARHIDDHLNRYLKQASRNIKLFARGKDIPLIVIGSHKEMFKDIAKHLPLEIKSKVVGEFIIDLTQPIDKILKKTEAMVSHAG